MGVFLLLCAVVVRSTFCSVSIVSIWMCVTSDLAVRYVHLYIAQRQARRGGLRHGESGQSDDDGDDRSYGGEVAEDILHSDQSRMHCDGEVSAGKLRD